MTGWHTLPAFIHFFVKIAIFELLYFLKFEAELYKKSYFCLIQYCESTYRSSFSFHSKISDILEHDAISKRGYLHGMIVAHDCCM